MKETDIKNFKRILDSLDIDIERSRKQLNYLESKRARVTKKFQKECPHTNKKDIDYFGMLVCEVCGKEFY